MNDDDEVCMNSGIVRDAMRALKGDRAAALEMWKLVSAGSTDPAVRVWLREVAHGVLEADAEPAKERPGAVLRAVGLSGVIDKHRAVREAAQTWRSFENLDGGRGPTLDQMAAELGVDPETLKNELRKG